MGKTTPKFREAISHLQTTQLFTLGETYAQLRDALLDFERQRLFGVFHPSPTGEALPASSSGPQMVEFGALLMVSEYDTMLEMCNFDYDLMLWSMDPVPFNDGQEGTL